MSFSSGARRTPAYDAQWGGLAIILRRDELPAFQRKATRCSAPLWTLLNLPINHNELSRIEQLERMWKG